MARKIVTLQSEFPYHVTARCINKQWFDIPMDDVWDVMERYLYLSQKMYDLRFHSFVLMPNHFHMMVTTPAANISRAMQFFMGQTSQEITRISGRINQTYGSRHHKSLITNWHHYQNVYKYVYRNPVKGGLSRKVEDYKYSTLHSLFGMETSIIPLVEDTLLFEGTNQTMDWLNTRPLIRHEKDIRNALKHPIFKLVNDRITNRKNELETVLM
jgi:putative transposase